MSCCTAAFRLAELLGDGDGDGLGFGLGVGDPVAGAVGLREGADRALAGRALAVRVLSFLPLFSPFVVLLLLPREADRPLMGLPDPSGEIPAGATVFR
jgi:hypothetical protein